MILTKIRLLEQYPMSTYNFAWPPPEEIVSWPLPTIDLDLDVNAGWNGYIFQGAVGLDPPDFSAIVIGFDSNGVPIKDTALAKRDIALKIALSPNLGQTYSHLRDAIYRLVNRSILVQLMNGAEVTAQVTGFVKSLEATHFTNSPEVLLTIECDESWFSGPEEITVPYFSVNDTEQPIINYTVGTAPTGITLIFNVVAPSPTGFKIYDHAKLWYEGPELRSTSFTSGLYTLFEVGFPLLTTDVVTMTTQIKDQRVMVYRGGVDYDITGYVNAGAVWPQLYSGVNTWRWSLDPSWSALSVLKYRPRYWGV